MKLSQIRTNPEREREGVPIEFGSGVIIRVRRLPNPAYENELQALLRKKPGLVQKKKRDVEDIHQLEECAKIAAAKHVIVSWEGILDEEEKEIPYSEAKALEIMQDPSLKDFANFIIEEASKPDNFRDSVGN